MKYRPKVGHMVCVDWDDSASANPVWMERKSAQGTHPVSVRSIGFVVNTTKRKLTIATGRSDTDFHCIFVIPTGAVQKVKRLR